MSDVLSLPSGAMRRPRLCVLANGAPVAGAQHAELVANNHYAADRFRVSVALGADPAMGADFWSAADALTLDVQIGFLPDGAPEGAAAWISLVQGDVDLLSVDPIGGTVRLDGRDRTALLIEARTQETFSNRTSSEIATILAGRHGLTAAVAATTTPVGRYYEIEHDRITLDAFSRATTEWDLLVWLAEREQFDVWVAGSTLYFQPASDAVSTMVLEPGALIDLSMERALTLARDIEVTVKSWNSRQQNAFTQTARSGSGGAPASNTPASYVYVRPNLTPDQALKIAQGRLTELSRHERVILASMPGELTLTPRTQIALTGTGTAFDQTYFIDRIERRLSVRGGFTQRVRARNVSLGSTATPPGDLVLSTVPNP